MRNRALLMLSLITLLPIGALAVLGARLVRGESERVRRAFGDLQEQRLREIGDRLSGLLRDREQYLLAHPGLLSARAPDEFRDFVRAEPVVRALVVWDEAGRVVFPPPQGPRSLFEQRDLLRQEQALFDRPGARVSSVAEEEAPGATSQQTVSSLARGPEETSGAGGASHGWYVWYHGNDLNLMLWQRNGGRVIGVEVDRYRLLADFVSLLPDEVSGEMSFELLDARGMALHHWGSGGGGIEVARLPLPEPLSAWQLRALAAAAPGTDAWGRSAVLGLGAGLLALALALAGLAVAFWRSQARAFREAERRVSFVNQVSHELKTPLTNIRLYAELLAERLDGAGGEAGRHLEVVVAESQRLGRLIDNVLTFGRHQRGALRLRPAAACLDEVVERVLQTFRPRLVERGVRVEFEPGAPARVLVDTDALEQILTNLLSNLEKYAAAGGLARVETRREGEITRLRVADRGPGVPAHERERIFQPFVRLSDNPAEGASGAGIGLAIVRELARLHGGEARLLDEGPGAVFEVRLHTPPAGAGEET